MMHVHGFGLSGRYLMPTARILAADDSTPSSPTSRVRTQRQDRSAARRAGPRACRDGSSTTWDRAGDPGRQLDGMPGHLRVRPHYPERFDRAVLVSPAGGLHNQPLAPRRSASSPATASASPPSLVTVALPDYVRFGVPSTFRMFRALTQYPSLERLLDLRGPDARRDRDGIR